MLCLLCLTSADRFKCRLFYVVAYKNKAPSYKPNFNGFLLQRRSDGHVFTCPSTHLNYVGAFVETFWCPQATPHARALLPNVISIWLLECAQETDAAVHLIATVSQRRTTAGNVTQHQVHNEASASSASQFEGVRAVSVRHGSSIGIPLMARNRIVTMASASFRSHPASCKTWTAAI